MSEPKNRPWLRKLLAFTISSLISLAVFEVVLRTFFPIYQASIAEAFEYDEELGTRLRRNVHVYEVTDFQNEVRTNEHGTSNFQESWEAYRTLVVASGDSYTQGTGLAVDQSYPSQLDLTLNLDESGAYVPSFGVINLGVPGYGGEQSLIAMKRWWSTAERKPAFILYLGCDNDYEDDVLFKSGYRHSHLVDGNPTWGPFVRPLRWLSNDLQTGIRTKIIIGNLRRRMIGVSDGVVDPNNPGPSPAESESDLLGRFANFATENGATLIVGWSDDTNSYDWAKRWASERGIAFADWRAAVVSTKAIVTSLPIDNSHSGGHHRGWVNRLIADAFAKQIHNLNR